MAILVTADYNNATGAAGGEIVLSNGASIALSSAGYDSKVAAFKAANPSLSAEIDAAVAEFDAKAAIAVNANRSNSQQSVDKEGIAAAAAAQDANTVKDPAIVAQEADIAARVAAIDANKKVQADVPATVDKEGIAAASAAQKQNELDQKVVAAAKTTPPTGNTASSVDAARASQTIAVARNTVKNDDWRVRLSLAPNAKYLYNLAAPTDILYPVKLTDGVIFPYTPTIQTAYKANYDSMNLTHTNYKMYFYKNSNVDEITLTADFTAQDTTEANYLLGVIHFFKSVTKMFYGQDGNNGPKAGTPPPLCYLNGYGQYQFNEHPVLISSFTYILPNDVDYIRAGPVTVAPGTNTDSYTKGNAASKKGFDLMSSIRKATSNLLGKQKGSASSPAEPKWMNYSNSKVTYVPTKMQIQLSLLPIVTRNDISKNFSLEKYATGDLLKGRNRPSGGGIW